MSVLTEILAELREIKQALAERPAAPRQRERKTQPDRRLWTIRATAKALGVDRSRLYEFIRSEAIKTVPAGGGRVRIPLEEIQRIEREGLPDGSTTSRPRSRRRSPNRKKPTPPTTGSPGDQIRNLKI